jgi:hypothetical protein
MHWIDEQLVCACAPTIDVVVPIVQAVLDDVVKHLKDIPIDVQIDGAEPKESTVLYRKEKAIDALTSLFAQEDASWDRAQAYVTQSQPPPVGMCHYL